MVLNSLGIWVMSPRLGSGAEISTLTMGSSTMGRASMIATQVALRAAVAKAMSFESTLWLLPSCTVTFTSSTG